MSLVSCRYNPKHRMKFNKREIHEQNCPDRLKCKTKYKMCPYDPLELIKEEDYESHLLICKHRPKISVEEQEEIEKERIMDQVATVEDQIKMARLTYYKDCVEEPEIVGIKKKQKEKNKKKQNKILGKQFSEVRKMEENHIVAMSNAIDDDNDGDVDGDGDDTHQIGNLPGEQFFDEIKNEGDEDENKIKNISKFFYKYNPNDEDKDLDNYPVHIVIPEDIYEILGENE